MRDLGAAGENYFSAWCAAAGMTANKSVSDMNGWDVFVEIDNNKNNSSIETIHEGLIETKIQIKATDGKKKLVDVELSNLKKMVTTTLPSFYVLMEFDNGYTPTNAYLLHVDNSLAGLILKRISQLSAQDENVKLNKKKMRLKFTTCISPLTPQRLKEMILDCIGPSHLDYMDVKRDYLRSAGYEEGGHQVKFSIKGDDTFQKLIDMSLGKKGHIEINNIHKTKLRFGVPIEHSSFSSDSALLELPDVMPSAKGVVTFRDKTSGRSLTFSVDLYRGIFNSWIPSELRKVRLDCELFEIQLVNHGKALTFTANTDILENFEIEENLKLFKLINMLGEPGNVSMNLSFPEITTNANLTASKGFEDCSRQLTILEKVTKIKRYFEFDGSLFLSPSKIDEKLTIINQLNFIIDGRCDVIKLTFSLDVEPKLSPETECFYVLFFELDNYLFIELLFFIGALSKSGEGRYFFVPDTKTTFYKTVLKAEDLNKEALRDELLNSMARHESSTNMVNLVPAFISNALKLDKR